MDDFRELSAALAPDQLAVEVSGILSSRAGRGLHNKHPSGGGDTGQSVCKLTRWVSDWLQLDDDSPTSHSPVINFLLQLIPKQTPSSTASSLPPLITVALSTVIFFYLHFVDILYSLLSLSTNLNN
ncbi:unnamed protein product [Pleuronectes platessa]|uniref:Uncharacterized protein n=1 Tax=Pleuronectes platessa TaxID=8262 RepID=A0A9N7TKX8_PLEPL|nr:unnamed protein product [Pleuronectes platessa]